MAATKSAGAHADGGGRRLRGLAGRRATRCASATSASPVSRHRNRGAALERGAGADHLDGVCFDVLEHYIIPKGKVNAARRWRRARRRRGDGGSATASCQVDGADDEARAARPCALCPPDLPLTLPRLVSAPAPPIRSSPLEERQLGDGQVVPGIKRKIERTSSRGRSRTTRPWTTTAAVRHAHARVTGSSRADSPQAAYRRFALRACGGQQEARQAARQLNGSSPHHPQRDHRPLRFQAFRAEMGSASAAAPLPPRPSRSRRAPSRPGIRGACSRCSDAPQASGSSQQAPMSSWGGGEGEGEAEVDWSPPRRSTGRRRFSRWWRRRRR